MKSLTYARQRARACRKVIGTAPDGLLQRIIAYLYGTYAIEVHAATQAFLEGGRAEVSPAEGCLFYDQRLDHDAAEKLAVILHELGHLELHARLQRCCAVPDPVYGSIYLNAGAPVLARYHRRAREEAEASAFASEFLCPSDELMQQWCQHAEVDTAALARRLGVSTSVVQMQLAEALYWLAVGEDDPQGSQERPSVTYDAGQLEAAIHTGCPVLVNAGPGTGKTATLIQRLVYLLEHGTATPEQLLVLTFSNDAVEELQERLTGRFDVAYASRITVSTFHGFGVTFLQHHGQFVSLGDALMILDQVGQEELVSRLLGSVDCRNLVTLHDPGRTVQAVVRHIGYLKDRLLTPDDYAAALAAWRADADERQDYAAAGEFLEVYRAYEAARLARQCVDFADLIALPARMLAQHTALRKAYQEKYRWVLVDEYQDVSRAVAFLLRQLCGPHNPPWVVGDARQAIYRFRGAAPENVARFGEDFPGARQFHLDTNYRSCPEIVQTANQLAGLWETPDCNPGTTYWKSNAPVTALTEPAVMVLQADSDQAEHDGIAAQIEAWLEMGVWPQEIAVLARRNVDVRNIALALGRRGIRAVTAGLMTPEGAAGDLAAVMTLADRVRASLPRLAFALGRGRFGTELINRVIKRLLESLGHEARLAAVNDEAEEDTILAAEVQQCSAALHAVRAHADAFTMLCVFLFDASAYLRRLLDRPPSAERALALSEIVTALSTAAAYRFAHPESDAASARLEFAQHFRASLSSSAAFPVPPKGSAEAVRVMTCHASKGLEFPCVVVAGQTLPQAPYAYPWLPPGLTPNRQDESAQADALLFVGATRAQRALVVTYASSASGAPRSRTRQIPPLLDRWQALPGVPRRVWPSPPATPQRTAISGLWGGNLPGRLPVRVLDPNSCTVRTYLEHYLGLRFPVAVQPLYPLFFDALRRTMGRIVRQAHEAGTPLGTTAARALLQQVWPQGEVAEHPYHDLYLNLACDYVERFTRAYVPQPPAGRHLGRNASSAAAGLSLQYDLLAHYEATDGSTVAIVWRPESLARHARATGLLWGGLRAAQRLAFVLLERDTADLRPQVFSAADGRLYPYIWSGNRPALEAEATRLKRRREALEQQRFETTVQEWTCNRCPVRLVCPYWLGASGDAGAA